MNKKNRIPLIIGSVVLLIGLVLVLALVVANGDDGDDGATGTTAATSPAAFAWAWRRLTSVSAIFRHGTK